MAGRLADLRVERGWSLDELARHTGVSRSTLSRLERAEISPTAAFAGEVVRGVRADDVAFADRGGIGAATTGAGRSAGSVAG